MLFIVDSSIDQFLDTIDSQLLVVFIIDPSRLKSHILDLVVSEKVDLVIHQKSDGCAQTNKLCA